MNVIAEQFVTAFLDPANLVGHIAYVLLIASMMMRNMNWLRALAIMAGAISAIYYWTLGDYVSMFWESLFSLVNIAQLVILMIENRRGNFSDEEQIFVKTCVPSLERAHARRLMKLGAWTQVQDEIELIAEDTCPSDLKFIVTGTARVERKNKTLGKVGTGDFLGEMSYLTGKKASASVITETSVRYLAFSRDVLKEHLEKNPEVRHALEASFNRNLIDKLVKTNNKNSD